MNYPYVLFFRHDDCSSIDSFISSNSNNINATIFITNNLNELNKLYNPNYQILISYGANIESIISEILPTRLQKKWMHFHEITDIQIFNNTINNLFIENCANRELLQPIFSIFTTTYNSYDKILRAYNSIKTQKCIDWEWVILDDSPNDGHFFYLKKTLLSDNRIRLYKRAENSGNIGNVKNEAISLCKGKYILEMDHDDEILPDTLQDSVDLFESNSEIGFIYMDFINLFENGNNSWYSSECLCKGYGAYYCQKYNNKWVFVYITPNINNITLSHLVCCPNHPRIWRTSVLLQIGNYCQSLAICDDYEILLRTALNTKMAKIHKLGYVQYMNDSNNNFSLIRNKEINRIGPNCIRPIYYNKFDIHNKMKELNSYEDEKFITNHSPIWKRDDSYTHKYCNLLVNPDYDFQYCIIDVNGLMQNIEKIQELYKNPRNDFLLLDSKNQNQILFDKLDTLNLDRIKCFYLNNHTNEMLINFFKVMYLSTSNFEIIC
jgi:glycosyltransferase involved in cell wall biosynthesis